jgi:hypothetical protein
MLVYNPNIKILDPMAGLFLSMTALVQSGITQEYVNRATSSGIFEAVKDKQDGRKVWVRYETLPTATKAKVDAAFPNIYAIAAISEKRHQAAQLILSDDAAFFAEQTPKKNGGAYTTDEIQSLTTACGWLRLADTEDKAKTYRAIIGGNGEMVKGRTAYFQWLAEACIKPLNLYGFNVGNGRILDKRLCAWRDGGHESLVSRYFGNDNRQVLSEIHQDFAIVHYAKNKKPVPQVVRLLEREFGLTITRQGLEAFLSRPEIHQQVVAMREGKLAAVKQTNSYLKMAKVPFADALWQVDGTPIALFYQAEDGKVKKSTWTRIVVRDVYSGCTVGVSYGESETTDLVKAAMRHAITTTGQMPHSVRYDGGSANMSHEMKRVFDGLSNYHFPTAPYRPTGKAAVEKGMDKIEKVLQSFDNFAGGNITTRGTEKQFNPDTLNAMKKAGRMPNSYQTIIQDWLAVEVLNNMVGNDGRTPRERYKDSHANRRRATIQIVADCFFTKRDRTLRYDGGGVTMQIGNDRLAYWVGTPMVEDYGFKQKHLGQSFQVRFNPDNRAAICLYDKEDRFVSEAVLKHEYSLLPDYRAEGEGEAFALMQANNKRYIAEGIDGYKQAEQRLEDAGLPTHYDFMTLHKDELARVEGAEKERLIAALAPPITKQKAVSKTDTKRDPSVSTPIAAPRKTNFFKEFAKSSI